MFGRNSDLNMIKGVIICKIASVFIKIHSSSCENKEEIFMGEPELYSVLGEGSAELNFEVDYNYNACCIKLTSSLYSQYWFPFEPWHGYRIICVPA